MPRKPMPRRSKQVSKPEWQPYLAQAPGRIASRYRRHRRSGTPPEGEADRGCAGAVRGVLPEGGGLKSWLRVGNFPTGTASIHRALGSSVDRPCHGPLARRESVAALLYATAVPGMQPPAPRLPISSPSDRDTPTLYNFDAAPTAPVRRSLAVREPAPHGPALPPTPCDLLPNYGHHQTEQKEGAGGLDQCADPERAQRGDAGSPRHQHTCND